MSDPTPAPRPAIDRGPRRPGRRLGRVAFLLAVLTVLLVWFVDVAEIARLLVRVDLGFCAAVYVVICLDLALMGAKWNLLLRAYGIAVPLRHPVLAYYRGQAFALFLPSILGMDAFRAWYLRRHGAPLGRVVPSIFVERFVGMLSSLSVIGLFLPVSLGFLGDGDMAEIGFVGWAGVLVLAAVLELSLHSSGLLSGSRVVGLLPGRLERTARGFLRAVADVRDRRGLLYGYYIVSHVEKLFYGTAFWLSARALGVESIGLTACLSVVPLVALFERLPVSVQALGLREALYIAVLHGQGVDPNVSVSVALVLRGAELLRLATGLLPWMFAREEGPRDPDLADLNAAMGRAPGEG